ncbi:MAG: glycosyl hydrolase 115 family protein [Bacteroides sp.]|nr:glycosyl hydrolase 115 family protein [Bacteroides sp.]
MKRLTFLFLFSLLLLSCREEVPFIFQKDTPPVIVYTPTEPEVVHTALQMLSQDYQRIFSSTLRTDIQEGTIYIGTVGYNSRAEQLTPGSDIRELKKRKEGFLLQNQGGKLIVLGSDKRGTAYGILEISRLLGISPWEWWADSAPAKKDRVEIPAGFRLLESPSVAHRGIFINDEDWGLTPWSYQNYEPSEIQGQIGPETHSRIFELLLRLRANTFWPAMHECSVPFYLTPGNKEVADKYGIYLGTSHCEPMMRNTNGEWKHYGEGSYDYVNNREKVVHFWEERVKELSGSDNIYTLGIRGVHDSKMLGANTIEEQKAAITNTLKDQRELIARHINPDVEQVSQVFIPYKEVLDVYHAGLEVPEDVSLMWCDDNYGYIRHFPNPTEQAQKGGNGIYYHISYWGRPHDYLWLSTTHPALIYTQMKMAYDKGARDMWILNVGDIKPAEYGIELFMDMAWNIEAIEDNSQGLDKHLRNWLAREFGEEHADPLREVMDEYYRLAWIRKPEFMGNTRTEEQDPIYKVVRDLPWSKEYIRERIDQYETIARKVRQIAADIPEEQYPCWYQLVEYPVLGATEMNKKHLYAQLARHQEANWALSEAAYNSIVSLTGKYNSLADGKWNYMMDYRPRRLPVFDPVPRSKAETPLPEQEEFLALFNGTDYTVYTGKTPVSHGLGYERKAITLEPGSSVTYHFVVENPGDVEVEVSLIPVHPVDGNNLRYEISVDGSEPVTVDYRTEGRSEEWKMNVLRNQALRSHEYTLPKAGEHTLTLSTSDEGVIVDQIRIRNG